MKKFFILLFTALCILPASHAQGHVLYDSLVVTSASGEDSLEVFTYNTGKVDISNGLATFNIPEGYKYLDATQTKYVLETIWGNPPSETVLGLLLPVNLNPYQPECWAITVEYEESGHIKDEDAKDIDYADLLKDMKESVKDESVERVKQGYRPYELVGWAVPPYYDQQNHKLHWAKEIKFGEDSLNTLNYNIRVLGKSGVLVLNVIAGMDQLNEVNANLNKVLASVDFNDGHRYDQFDASIDKVAAYGIGGLIAGKVLAKVGFFALLLKFWKLIAIAVVGAFAALKNRIFGKKKEEPVITEQIEGQRPADQVQE
jgi:uncharacterized membrane-anchored protein